MFAQAEREDAEDACRRQRRLCTARGRSLHQRCEVLIDKAHASLQVWVTEHLHLLNDTCVMLFQTLNCVALLILADN